MYLTAHNELGELGGGVPLASQILAGSIRLLKWAHAHYAPDHSAFTDAQVAAWISAPKVKMGYPPWVGEVKRVVNAYKKAPIDPAVTQQVASALNVSAAAADKAILKNRADIAHQYDSNPLSLDTALKIAAFAAAGAWLATATAGAGGAVVGGATGGTGSGLTAGAGFGTGGGLSPWASHVLAPVAGGGLTAGGTLAGTALATLKKLAIDYGVEYAMGKAAEYYATQQQKKMAASQEKVLQAELEAAKAEYEKLVDVGVTPKAAASQATLVSASIPTGSVLLIGAGILALLLFSKRSSRLSRFRS